MEGFEGELVSPQALSRALTGSLIQVRPLTLVIALIRACGLVNLSTSLVELGLTFEEL